MTTDMVPLLKDALTCFEKGISSKIKTECQQELEKKDPDGVRMRLREENQRLRKEMAEMKEHYERRISELTEQLDRVHHSATSAESGSGAQVLSKEQVEKLIEDKFKQMR